MKRLSIFLVTVALIAGMVGCGGEAVTFSDPNLEAAVKEAIGEPTGSICLADLEGLTSLEASSTNIADVIGLESCTSLTYLCLEDNQLSDISPVANLNSLTELYLGNNQISDVSPLVDNEGLSTGDEVYLARNPLSSDSINTYIRQLDARGVTIDY